MADVQSGDLPPEVIRTWLSTPCDNGCGTTVMYPADLPKTAYKVCSPKCSIEFMKKGRPQQ